MGVNIRRIFKKHCGRGALYLGSELQQRGEHNTVMVTFEIVPEGWKFQLDGVLHCGETHDEQLTNAVLRIAEIAKNIRATLAAPDGGPGRPAVSVERLLS
jgi:hypothetical protein